MTRQPSFVPTDVDQMDDDEEEAVRERVRAARRRGPAGGRRSVVISEPVLLDEDFEPPVVEKTAEEEEEIAAAVASNLLFNALDEAQTATLVRAMERREFPPGGTIIRQGDQGDFFYVQASGRCRVEVGGECVLVTGPGQSFGELALLYDSPRAASVLVDGDEPVRAWAIDRMTFKQVVVASAIAKRRRFAAAVSGVPLLQALDAGSRAALLDCLLPLEVDAGAVVVEEGQEDADRFYIVEQGQLKAVSRARVARSGGDGCARRCSSPWMPNAAPPSGDSQSPRDPHCHALSFHHPTPPQTKEGVEGEACPRLGPGDFFGERAILTGDARAATVQAVTDCTLIALDKAAFVRLLGPVSVRQRPRRAPRQALTAQPARPSPRPPRAILPPPQRCALTPPLPLRCALTSLPDAPSAPPQEVLATNLSVYDMYDSRADAAGSLPSVGSSAQLHRTFSKMRPQDQAALSPEARATLSSEPPLDMPADAVLVEDTDEAP